MKDKMKSNNSHHNIIISRGTRTESELFHAVLKQRCPDAVQEAPEEAQRHIEWLKAEIGGFVSAESVDHVTAAYYFITAPAPSPLCPATLVELAELIASWKNRLTLGFVAIDKQRVPYAAALAICTDTSQSILGSLGGDRNAYFRILRHFHD